MNVVISYRNQSLTYVTDTNWKPDLNLKTSDYHRFSLTYFNHFCKCSRALRKALNVMNLRHFDGTDTDLVRGHGRRKGIINIYILWISTFKFQANT